MQNSPARSSIDVGSVIAGTYTIEALVGRGGMGAVFLASHARLPGKKVAIKVLHAEMSGDEVDARFKREAQIASLLSHPNIVHIEDYNVTAEGMPYLVLEYLQGESLAQRLRNGPMSIDQAFSVIRQVGSALAAAHGKGIIHRDLKPQNIFLVPSDIDGRSMEIAKVLDFGISKMRDSQTVKTQDSALLGTPQYMAPEQALGQHDKVDERTDVFALGAIVYEMLSGVPAFSGETIPEVVFKVVYEEPVPLATRVPNLPETVTTAVKTAMTKAAADRYASVPSFIEGLTGAPISVMRIPNQPAHDTGSGARTPSTGKEAFAQTMGSGDHGAKPISSQSGGAATEVNVEAPTIASQNAVPDVGIAATTSSQSGVSNLGAGTASSQAPGAPKAPRPRGAMLAGLILGVAAIVGGAIYLVTRESKPASQAAKPTPIARPNMTAKATTPAPIQPAPPTTTPAAVPVGAPPLGSGGAAIATDAAVGSAPAPAPADRKVAKPSQPQPIIERAIAEEAADHDTSHAGMRLHAAEQALARKQWESAEQHANAVINSEDARPKQRARALVVHAIVACAFRHDDEVMATDLRKLGPRTALKAQVRRACAKAKQE